MNQANHLTGILYVRGTVAPVTRQMGKVCVAGCEAVEVLDAQSVRIGAKTFREGDYLSINGSTGNVYEDFINEQVLYEEARRLDFPNDEPCLGCHINATGGGYTKTNAPFEKTHLHKLKFFLLDPSNG
jgi:hypothetical protein